MSKTIQVPNFGSESEEADWWYDHREEHGVIMAQAMEKGRTTTMKEFLEKQGLEWPRISVQLDFDDMVQARKQAVARGVDAEVYIRSLLHEALLKSDAAREVTG